MSGRIRHKERRRGRNVWKPKKSVGDEGTRKSEARRRRRRRPLFPGDRSLETSLVGRLCWAAPRRRRSGENAAEAVEAAVVAMEVVVLGPAVYAARFPCCSLCRFFIHKMRKIERERFCLGERKETKKKHEKVVQVLVPEKDDGFTDHEEMSRN